MVYPITTSSFLVEMFLGDASLCFAQNKNDAESNGWIQRHIFGGKGGI